MSVAFDTAIKLWVETISQYTSNNVFKAYEPAPRPNGDYITFRKLNGTIQNYPMKSTEVDEFDATTKYDKFTSRAGITYQIDVYSEYGETILNALWGSRNIWQIRKALSDSGLTIKSNSIWRHLPFLKQNEYFPRYNMDFTFSYYDTVDINDYGYIMEIWNSFRFAGKWKQSETEEIDLEISSEQFEQRP